MISWCRLDIALKHLLINFLHEPCCVSVCVPLTVKGGAEKRFTQGLLTSHFFMSLWIDSFSRPLRMVKMNRSIWLKNTAIQEIKAHYWGWPGGRPWGRVWRGRWCPGRIPRRGGGWPRCRGSAPPSPAPITRQYCYCHHNNQSGVSIVITTTNQRSVFTCTGLCWNSPTSGDMRGTSIAICLQWNVNLKYERRSQLIKE